MVGFGVIGLVWGSIELDGIANGESKPSSQKNSKSRHKKHQKPKKTRFRRAHLHLVLGVLGGWLWRRNEEITRYAGRCKKKK